MQVLTSKTESGCVAHLTQCKGSRGTTHFVYAVTLQKLHQWLPWQPPCQQDLLFACTLSELGSLKNFDTSVIVILLRSFASDLPILLMLQRRPGVIQVPRSTGHILWYMWVDLLAFLIDLSGSYAGFSCLLKLFLPSVVLMVLEQCVRGRHSVTLHTATAATTCQDELTGTVLCRRLPSLSKAAFNACGNRRQAKQPNATVPSLDPAMLRACV